MYKRKGLYAFAHQFNDRYFEAHDRSGSFHTIWSSSTAPENSWPYLVNRCFPRVSIDEENHGWLPALLGCQTIQSKCLVAFEGKILGCNKT
jgi:hypothetical protein